MVTSNTFSVTVDSYELLTEDTLIEVYPLSVWFRGVVVGGSNQQTIYIHNPSAASITLNSDTMSNAHYVEGVAPTTIAPGASATITVTFTPESGWSTNESGTYTLVFDNGETKTIQLWSQKFNSARTTQNVTAAGTLSASGTRYILQNDINATFHGFVIDATNIELDLNGYTLTYGTGGSNSACGVYHAASWSDATYGSANFCTGLRVTNGTIKQVGYDTASSTGSDQHGIYIAPGNGDTDVELDNLTINVDGHDAQAIRSVQRRPGFWLHDNTFNSKVTTITNRHSFDGAQVFFDIDTGGRYNRCHDNVFYDSPQTGYRDDSAGFQVYSNSFDSNARFTNDFAINGGSSNCLVFDNTLTCRSSRGIAPCDTGARIYRNNIDVKEIDQNDEYGGCQIGGSYGFQIEGLKTQTRFYHNTVLVHADRCDAVGFRITSLTGTDNLIEKNTFTVQIDGDELGNAYAVSIGEGYTAAANNCNVIDNTFTFDTAFFQSGWDGPQSLVFENNVIQTGTNADPTVYLALVQSGHASATSEEIGFQDCSLTGVGYTNLLSTGTPGFTCYDSYTLSVYVHDNGTPIITASVVINDNDATEVFNDTTDASGLQSAVLQNNYRTVNGGISTNAETPHDITITKAGYTQVDYQTTMSTAKAISVNMATGAVTET